MSAPSPCRRRFNLTLTLPAVASLLTLPLARAATYPSRTVELVVPAAPGGGTDILTRAFGTFAQKHLSGGSFAVMNKGGASGGIGMAEVRNAKPDGYKIGMIIAELSILPALKRLSFTSREFAPIAQLNADPAAITVRADSKWKRFEDFLADARSEPGKVSMGDSGNGSIWHLASAALADKVGTRFTQVNFPGAAPAVVALLGAHVDAVAVSPGEVAQHVASGALRTLAVMDDRRQPGLFADVPTVKEKGIDLSTGTWRGLAAPKGTPQPIIDALADLARKVSDDPAFRETLVKASLGPAFLDAAAFQARIERDNAFFGDLATRLKLAD